MAHDHDHQIDAYVRRLIWSLQALPHDDRLAIASELHDHLLACSARGTTELDKAIARLGRPDALARAYVEEYELAGAINRSSPAPLLFSVLNRATRSTAAFFGGLAALALYSIALASAAIAVGKMIRPDHVGAWNDAAGFSAGIVAAVRPGQEMMGYGIIPAAVLLGGMCFIVAHGLLRIVGRTLIRRGTMTGWPPSRPF